MKREEGKMKNEEIANEKRRGKRAGVENFAGWQTGILRITTFFIFLFSFFFCTACIPFEGSIEDVRDKAGKNGRLDPVANDFEISNLTQIAGSVIAVSIIPKEGKSTGAITIYYEGTSGTNYTKSQTIPQIVGIYAVTFDVAAVNGWNAAAGLSAGTLTVNIANLDPVAADFDIGNLNQTVGSVTAVTVTPKAGKSSGTITIFYNGSTVLPSAAGTYTVTFNVAVATGWNAVAGLFAGTLVVNDAANPTPVAGDFEIIGLTQTYDGNPKPVLILPKDGKSTGIISIFYSGNSTPQTSAGTYSITFAVAASPGWNAAINLPGGDLVINPRTLSISGVNASNRIFSPGLTTVTLSGGVLQGILSGDTVNFTLGSGTMANADAGNNKAVTTAIQISGASAGNYSLTQPSGLTVNISRDSGATVNAPELDSRTLNSISVKAVSTPANGQIVEYARNTVNTVPQSGWQDGLPTGFTFNGLIANSTYYIFARAKENNNYNAGTPSGTAITTLASFSLNFEQIIDDDAVLPWTGAGGPIAIQHSSGASVNITLDNFSQYSFVEWHITSKGISQTNTASFELKPSDFNRSDIGIHSLTVEVVKDGAPYNRTIPVWVSD